MYKNKKVLVGVTGGIAAYKTCELVRLLKKQGADVTVIMTSEAQNFIHPNTFKALTGHEVISNLLNDGSFNGMSHINLTRNHDVFIIAPCTQNTIAKIANGICDNLLTTAVQARACPLVIAPAMNHKMWSSAANQRNIQTLIQDGVYVLRPNSGELACLEEGEGRMKEPHEILDLTTDVFYEKELLGMDALLTVGGTYEPIDPVRGITNISSGKMGMALARSLRQHGANVTIVYSQIKTNIPSGIRAIYQDSAQHMYEKVMNLAPQMDYFIGVAAVADFKMKESSDHKIKKDPNSNELTLTLTTNPDIIRNVAKLDYPPFTVAFAAESQNLDEYAHKKLKEKNVHMLIANLVSQAMGKDTTKICIFNPNMNDYPVMSKEEASEIITQSIIQLSGDYIQAKKEGRRIQQHPIYKFES